MSYADETLLGQQTRRVVVVRALESELERLLVHPLNEAFGPPRRHPRQRPRGGVVGRDEQQVQQVAGRQLVVRAQKGRGGA